MEKEYDNKGLPQLMICMVFIGWVLGFTTAMGVWK